MNESSSTKTSGGLSLSRKASSRLVGPGDSATNPDRNTHTCSRVGCGSKINSTQGNHNPKTTRTLRSDPCKKPPSHQTSNLPFKAEASKHVIRSNNPKIKLDKLGQSDGSGEASSSSSNPHSRNGKRVMTRPEFWKKYSSTSASSSSLALKKGNHGVRNGASVSKHRLNDVGQSSELNLGRKRIGEAERSVPSRGKKINGESSHDGISIRTSNSPSVGIQRSTARVRRLNKQDDSNSNRMSNVFVNEDNAGQYSLDEIAEMLLALERIEQDEDVLLYEEQLVVLGTNLFLSGISLHDQHREMRLDIDNMSYEELLALEERMGNVSTALSEEALKKCLMKSIINNTTEQGTPSQEDDIKCSICQEEYKEGNEVGKLGCEHKYHVKCIEKWLRLKNWCPVCKASAAPSPLP